MQVIPTDMMQIAKHEAEPVDWSPLHGSTTGYETTQDSYVAIRPGKPSSSLSDEEIMWELRDGMDQKLANDLFAELFNRYETRVQSWCLRFTSDHNQTLDLTQEIFLKVYRNSHSYRGNSKFSTWLYAIARNHCFSARKKRAAEPVERASLISELHQDVKALDQYSVINRVQSWRRIWSQVSSALNPVEARVMIMHYAREIPLATITRELALSNRSGAKAYIVSARRKLNGALRPQDPGLGK